MPLPYGVYRETEHDVTPMKVIAEVMSRVCGFIERGKQSSTGMAKEIANQTHPFQAWLFYCNLFIAQ